MSGQQPDCCFPASPGSIRSRCSQRNAFPQECWDKGQAPGPHYPELPSRESGGTSCRAKQPTQAPRQGERHQWNRHKFLTSATLEGTWCLTLGLLESEAFCPNSGLGWAWPPVPLPGSYLGGCEDNDVLDIAPCETGPYLQHEGYHASCQRSSRRGPCVALCAASALLKVPVSGHLGSGAVRALEMTSALRSASRVGLATSELCV